MSTESLRMSFTCIPDGWQCETEWGTFTEETYYAAYWAAVCARPPQFKRGPAVSIAEDTEQKGKRT